MADLENTNAHKKVDLTVFFKKAQNSIYGQNSITEKQTGLEIDSDVRVGSKLRALLHHRVGLG